MKITILNGSPKGDFSGTLKYIEYLRIKHPEHEYEIFHIAKKIKGIVSIPEKYQEILSSVKESDGVIISFPLYYLMVHSGLKQFFEFVLKRKDEKVFCGKYAAAVSTSIHYFDNTAHCYVQGIAEDFGMNFVDSFSPGMKDFLKPDGRKQFLFFAEGFLESMKEKSLIARKTNRINHSVVSYKASKSNNIVNAKNKRIIIVADELKEGGNLSEMVKRFSASIEGDVEIAEMNKMRFAGGCMGCLKCAWNNKCAYEGKDDYIEFFKNRFMTADIIVYAGTIKDRFLSWQWNRFMERNFWRTHSPAFNGQQVGLLVSGPLSQLENIKNIFQGYFEVQKANLLGFVTDESGDTKIIDQELSSLAKNLVNASFADYKKPITFPGVGGAKIFRDDIYTDLKAIFKSDYKFFKKHKMFDLPQKKRFSRIMGSIFHVAMKISPLRKKFTGIMKQGMVMRHDIILKKEKQEGQKKLVVQTAKV